jgi:hypothetical protein
MGIGSSFIRRADGVPVTGDVFKLSAAAFDLSVAGAFFDALLCSSARAVRAVGSPVSTGF